jgi:hypothetical protein
LNLPAVSQIVRDTNDAADDNDDDDGDDDEDEDDAAVVESMAAKATVFVAK